MIYQINDKYNQFEYFSDKYWILKIIFQTNSMVQRVGSAWGQERVDGQIHEEQILHDSPVRPGLAHLHPQGANQEEIGKSLI